MVWIFIIIFLLIFLMVYQLDTEGFDCVCADLDSCDGYTKDCDICIIFNDSNVKCIAGDIRKLDIPESFFDVISVIHVMHDIASGERRSITDRLAKLLDKNGEVYIREPIKESHGIPGRKGYRPHHLH